MFPDGRKASWPTSKKNRHLQLAVASGCHLTVHSDIRLLFLIGRMILTCFILEGKFFIFTRIYLLLHMETISVSLFYYTES